MRGTPLARCQPPFEPAAFRCNMDIWASPACAGSASRSKGVFWLDVQEPYTGLIYKILE